MSDATTPREPLPPGLAPVAGEDAADLPDLGTLAATPHDKKTWRTALRAHRRHLAVTTDTELRARAGEHLAAAGLAHVRQLGGPDLSGQIVTSYEALRTEAPTAALNSALLDAGARVIVPVTLDDMRLEWVELFTDGTRSELLGVEAIGRAHVILTPALAADATGTRLGQGGGCYDRALTHVDAAIPVTVIVHPHEVLPAGLPRDAHDRPISAALTTEGTTWMAGAVGA